jgi:hypothetical protein
VTLIDENVEDIDFERVGSADMVCLTGMNIQGQRLIEILQKVKSRGVMTVVGGPMATVSRNLWRDSPMLFSLARRMRLGLSS